MSLLVDASHKGPVRDEGGDEIARLLQVTGFTHQLQCRHRRPFLRCSDQAAESGLSSLPAMISGIQTQARLAALLGMYTMKKVVFLPAFAGVHALSIGCKHEGKLV